MRVTHLSLIALITSMLLAVPAGATMNYFNNQTDWLAATSNVFTIDFNDVSVNNPPGYVDYSATGVQLLDVTFTANPASDGGIQVGDMASGCISQGFGAGNYFLCGNTWGSKYFEAGLPAAVTAVAMNLQPAPYANSITLTFSSGDSQVIPALGSQTPVFAGFVFTQPITSLTFESGGANFIGVDNFQYNQLEETPEAGTALLGGLGIVSLVMARRMRLRRC